MRQVVDRKKDWMTACRLGLSAGVGSWFVVVKWGSYRYDALGRLVFWIKMINLVHLNYSNVELSKNSQCSTPAVLLY